MVIAGFLRLVTNERVFVKPDSIEDAIAFVDALLASPGVELRAPGAEWPLLRDKLLRLGLQGNFVADAWIAAATEVLSEFGSTSCKALWRCTACREPFDYFKCH